MRALRSAAPSYFVILSEGLPKRRTYAERFAGVSYFVYIMTNRTHTLYTGITGDILRRVHEHRTGEPAGFTSKYKIHRLVHLEEFDDVGLAIAREKEIKGWLRQKKIELIESANPTWKDLSLEWFPDK